LNQTPETMVFESAVYSCARCGTKAAQTELQGLPSPRCAACGFTVFTKTRPDLVKRVRAV
jgi:DNA-directed RNA polymerase subunit RPC12/RpoP